MTEETDFAVKDAAALWEQKAKTDAPKDTGGIVQSISSKKLKDMDWEVVSPKEYSPYIEWGTKSRVRVPAELTAYAMQFKRTGPAGGAKAIYEWCRRVGIPQNQWIFVYLSIIRKGVHPHPFFFIQMPFVETQLVNDIKTILTTEH